AGGAALPVEVLRGFEEAFGCIILEGYGLSETSPVASFNHPDRERKPGSIGTPIDGVEMRLVGLAGNEVAAGEVGEITGRGHNLMKGYWGNQAHTRAAPPGGVACPRGPGPPGRGRLLLHRRPQEGPDHPGRLQRLPPGGRGGALRAPGGSRGGRGRPPPPGARGGSRGRRGPQARGRGHPGGAAGLLPGADRGLQVPSARLAGGGPAQDGHRQAPAPRGGTARGAVTVGGRPPAGPPPPGADAAAASLDLLLAAGALGPAYRLLPGGAGARFATAPARPPHTVAPRAPVLAGELARVGLGRSSLGAAPTDRRFTDAAWTSNPLLRRLLQAYLAAGRTAEELLTDADLAWRDTERLRFVIDNLVQAL